MLDTVTITIMLNIVMASVAGEVRICMYLDSDYVLWNALDISVRGKPSLNSFKVLVSVTGSVLLIFELLVSFNNK